MYKRIYKISNNLKKSIFLFGALLTGKSTILRKEFSQSIYIELLDTSIKSRFSRRPALLYEILLDKPAHTCHNR